ncbi:MAG TPA: glycosyltransferase family 1 protein [Spirochaetales bacterium]|nr:glycosyltransferase family 1 protein [Spirochaetales bacterium]HRY53119.1 glycosyltransferase family 1 protein [Spirochaetia bacterium]HRZ64664.1 glycosyltransferase family 1 protein [Spirochaetia bacterium]
MEGKDSGRGRAARIAVFTKPLDNWTSGSGHHLDEIMKAVLDLNEGRFDFTFVHYKPSQNPIYKRVRELVVPRSPLRSAAVLRREKFDLVHYSPLTIYAPIWGVPGKKLATIHGAEQLLVPQFYGKVELAHEYLVVPPYARRMDAIVTVSNASADFFVRRYRVAPERITVCYNGLGPAYRVLPDAEITAPERYGVRRPFVLHISRLSERKNPWKLLEAYARLVQEHDSPCSLVCAGGGWNGEEVLERARSLGIAELLCTPGFITERDAVELMNAARAFVFPSLAEGFGMPNVEAMACGCPVVTTPAFAVREIVGDAALVVEDPSDPVALAEALHRATTDEALRARLRERGFARLPLFSWEDSARKLIGVYERLTRA